MLRTFASLDASITWKTNDYWCFDSSPVRTLFPRPFGGYKCFRYPFRKTAKGLTSWRNVLFPVWICTTDEAGALAEQPVGGAQSHGRPRLRDAGVEHAGLHGRLCGCSGHLGQPPVKGAFCWCSLPRRVACLRFTALFISARRMGACRLSACMIPWGRSVVRGCSLSRENCASA